MTLPGGHADGSYLLDSAGPAAPPRDNGELVFAAPWESQAFGVALALHDAGAIDWEAAHPSGEGWNYYQCWLGALEQLLSGTGLVSAGDLRARLEQLAARPAGHDHRHEHRHDHET